MWKLLIFVSVLIAANAAPSKNGRIFNGEDANREEWPWMVAIYRNGNYRCGGVLIKEQYVLTAAHCVDRTGVYTAVLGDYDVSDNNGDEQSVGIEEITLHPDYDDTFYDNDIAVLKINESALVAQSNIALMETFSDSVNDERARKEKRIECWVTGWGYMTDSKSIWTLAEKLQELEVDVVGDGKCRDFFLGTTGPTNVCYKNKRGSTCSGDSGNPIVCDIDGVWMLLGLHSFRFNFDGCRGGPKAGARISLYTDWINGITNPVTVQ